EQRDNLWKKDREEMRVSKVIEPWVVELQTRPASDSPPEPAGGSMRARSENPIGRTTAVSSSRSLPRSVQAEPHCLGLPSLITPLDRLRRSVCRHGAQLASCRLLRCGPQPGGIDAYLERPCPLAVCPSPARAALDERFSVPRPSSNSRS